MATGEPSFTLSNSTDSITTSNPVDSVGYSCTDWTTYTPVTWSYSYPYYGVDKTRQAFQIIKMLEEKKMIKLTSVKKFMELVDEIYTVL